MEELTVIRIAEPCDTLPLAIMMKKMAMELHPDSASKDDNLYWKEAFKYIRDPEYYVYIYIDVDYIGFFMVKDDYDPIFPSLKRYIGTKVYIETEHRKGRVLHEFYSKLFEDFPEGDILGLTEIESEHIAVLNKRHNHIANVYKLERR